MNQKIDWAPVFDANRRPVEQVTLDDLQNVGVAFNAYGVGEGDTITIDKNPTIIKQAPRLENGQPTYLVAVKRNGINSWLNPMFFLRTDVDRNPIYPNWYALGSAQAVVQALIATGTVVGGKTSDYNMSGFNRDGSARMVAKRNADGSIVLKSDGTPDLVRDVDIRHYPELNDPKLG